MTQDEVRDRAAIQQLGQDWVEAVHHGDVDRLLDLVTDDAVFMPHNAPSIVGRAAVEQAYRAVFAAFEVDQTFAPEERRLRRRAANLPMNFRGGPRVRNGCSDRHPRSRSVGGMLLANLYLLAWDYDRLRTVLFRDPPPLAPDHRPERRGLVA